MTIESCQAFCSSSTYNYGLAGLEYASQCYCGNGLQSGSTLGYSKCNTACKGNSSEICGGSGALSVYNLTSYVPPTTVKAVGSYVSKGCYNELKTGRLLSGASYTNTTGMSVESCVAFCNTKSLAYAGLEYAKECYCGSSLPTTATTVGIGSCNMLCTGNRKEFCGASSLLNVYYNDPSTVDSGGDPDSINQPNVATVTANTTAPAGGTASPAARKRDLVRRARFGEGRGWAL
ncbi:Carbohydrate-binding WSC, subgroup [Lasallia pustulata]|nr:Carbohydrate-binding WSC, subgroup [Lasallia pustulata]